jgi:4-carboxymuconolactone decarboxylase
MSRLAQLTRNELNGEARAAFERIATRGGAEKVSGAHADVYGGRAASNRDSLSGPFNIWMRSPGLAENMTGLSNFLRYQSALPPRVQELVTLIVAQRNGAAYAWVNHLGYAAKSGLSEAVIAALEKGQRPEFGADLDAAVFDFTTQLLDTRSVGDAAYRAVLSHLGEAGIVELVSQIGFYVMITLSLNAFQAPIPEGTAAPFGG